MTYKPYTKAAWYRGHTEESWRREQILAYSAGIGVIVAVLVVAFLLISI